MAELGSSSLTSRKLVLIPPMSSPVCMACVPASYVDLECKHLFESADVAAAGAQGCSCDSLVYVYLRREQDGVHCLSNLTKIKNNIGNVYSSHCVHIHHVYSSPCVHIHHVYSSTSFFHLMTKRPLSVLVADHQSLPRSFLPKIVVW